MKELRFSDVPDGWALCFNGECLRQGRCLRYRAGVLAPNDFTVSRCVTPKALVGGACPHFAPIATARYAKGFTHIYDQVLKNDYTPLRKTMTEHLQNKRYYYAYMRGERLLSPAQQQWIIDLFAQYGYTKGPFFDDFEEVYEFPRI